MRGKSLKIELICFDEYCQNYDRKKENCGLKAVFLNDLGSCDSYKHSFKIENPDHDRQLVDVMKRIS